ncbi:hypothetical protein Patl1_29127 [Pistacia atlantica]|uniref:Uncharacterized protein n=1 Tax=Pistacia atlantica TaxID=434234 RepID=A0ACC1BEF1_9ROSI|nr:hypothetical protein Patl1_29127 [Pistacia atlantica]
MSSQENDGTSRNPCANGCGSLVPAENSNYCNNCFKLLLAEEQAAVTAAERAEAAYSNETNPGENWVRAQMSTITLEQWISMIRRKERARQFEDSPLSFSELLGITRRNDDRGDELDTMESSSTVPPPLTLGSESNECSRSGEVEQARVVRCPVCRKKVGPMKYKCKCGGVFCIFHRLSEDHECCYDYKALGRQAIAKANPVIKRHKLKRI